MENFQKTACPKYARSRSFTGKVFISYAFKIFLYIENIGTILSNFQDGNVIIFKNHQELAPEKEPMCYSSYKIRSKNPR